MSVRTDLASSLRHLDARTFRAGMIPWVLIVAGAIPRLRQYLEARPLWLDEAQLADNILTHSTVALFGPLDHAQVAPPGYLLLLKASVGLLGPTEYAVRLPSLIAGLAALFLFAWAARKVFSDFAAVVSLAFFAAAGHLIYYSSECKPYSVDVAVALALLCLTLARPEPSRRGWGALIAAGMLAPWFSFPALFSLLAIGGAFAADSLQKRNWKRFGLLCAVGTAWLASFGVLYIVNIRPVQAYAATMNYMAEYWRYGQAFMPVPPSLEWIKGRFLLFFDNPGGLRMALPAGLVFIVGGYAVCRRNPRAFALVFGPLLIALLVSATGKYPFHGRMTLFLAPCLFLLLGAGLAQVAETWRGRMTGAALILGVLLLASPGVQAARVVLHPKSHHEINRALEHVERAWQPGDLLYMRHAEGLAYQYCRHRYRFTESDLLREPRGKHTPEGMAEFVSDKMDRLRSANRVWIIVTYDSPDVLNPYLDVLNKSERAVDRADFLGATAIAYDFL